MGGRWRPNVPFFSLILLIGCGKSCAPFAVRFAPSAVPWTDLSSEQQNLFGTDQNARARWDALANDVTKPQIEFAAGTRALNEACELKKCADSLVAIHGDLGPSQHSEGQFNVELNWATDAAAHFSDWDDHIAVLHDGQEGYQESRDGNPFLGLVVLFDKEHGPTTIRGQFHIGFRSWFAHYKPVNGNIADKFNYECYCEWYGRFDSFEPFSETNLLTPESSSLNFRPTSSKSALVDSVEDFLTAWYVRRDYMQFRSYIAIDNAYQAAEKATRRAVTEESLIVGLFNQAFASQQPQLSNVQQSLTDFIYSPPVSIHDQIIAPAAVGRPASPNLNGPVYIFQIYTPDEFKRGSVIPRTEPRDDSARFLFELQKKYQPNIRIVIYVVRPNTGLAEETAVMFWIREPDNAWKLAAYQGTDW